MSEIPHPKSTPEAMKEIQDSIYREKILRARAMTPGERCSDTLETSTFQAALMHAGAMKRLGTDDEAAGWKEVRRGLDRLAKVHENGFYTTERPVSA